MPEGILAMVKEMLEKAHEVNPNFALASETCWDRTFQFVDVSYVRMNDIDMPSPALRYTFPEWTSTICAESPGDFNVMNNGMRYGLVWAMQPRHYNDSMDDPLTRPLSRYVQELIRIQRQAQGVALPRSIPGHGGSGGESGQGCSVLGFRRDGQAREGLCGGELWNRGR